MLRARNLGMFLITRRKEPSPVMPCDGVERTRLKYEGCYFPDKKTHIQATKYRLFIVLLGKIKIKCTVKIMFSFWNFKLNT